MKRVALVGTAIVVSIFPIPASAQWIDHPSAVTPRTEDGSPDLTAPAPRDGAGNLDLSGIWTLDSSSIGPILGRSQGAIIGGNFSLQLWSPGGAEIPMRTETEAVFNQRVRSFGAGRPAETCLPHSIPDGMVVSVFKITQNPGLTLILYEEFARFRQILTDGRAHPEEMTPAWFGYSVGTWDHDTFVVDTVGYNNRSWLDDAGHPHSEALHTIERFRRTDFGHLIMDLTIDDPVAYKKPWSIRMQFTIMPDTELIEDLCDNEKDLEHISDVSAWGPEAPVATEVLAKHAGSYEFTVDNFHEVMEVSLSNGHLKYFGAQLRPVSDTEFAGTFGSIRFDQDGAGETTGMTVINSNPSRPQAAGPLRGVRVK